MRETEDTSLGCLIGMILTVFAGFAFLIFMCLDMNLGLTRHAAVRVAGIVQTDTQSSIVFLSHGRIDSASVSREQAAVIEKGMCVGIAWTEGRWTKSTSTNRVETVALPDNPDEPRCIAPERTTP